MASSSDRLMFLDSLRALAIAMVVWLHVSELYNPNSTIANVGAFWGRGVQLFFIVSAFTLLTVEHDVKYWRFLGRRFFRIFPMLYIGIVFYTIRNGMGASMYSPHGVTPIDVILNFAFLNAWFPNAAYSVMPGGWSISCEAMFYLAFPILMMKVRSVRESSIFLLFTIVGSLITMGLILKLGARGDPTIRSYSYLNPIGQAPAFAFGFLVYFVFHSVRNRKISHLISPIVVLSSLMTLVVLSGIGGPLARFHMIADGVLAILTLSVALSPPRWLVNPWTAYVGRISYSVYVIHFGVIGVIGRLFKDSVAAAPIAYLAIFAISIALSGLSYRFIERPMIRFGRSLIAPERPKLSLPAS